MLAFLTRHRGLVLDFRFVEYHTVYGVSPWTTRTYLLPYRVVVVLCILSGQEESGGEVVVPWRESLRDFSHPAVHGRR